MSRRPTAFAAAMALLVAACDSGTIHAPETPEPAAEALGPSLVPIDPLASTSALINGRLCSRSPYRQFDFWVGNWDVRSAGTFVGTNVVEKKLDGCAVIENWKSAFQGTGKSLNVYDASTRTWSQMWVGSGGCPTAVIVMEGTFANGSMTLQGRREQPLGFLFAPPCAPPPNVVVFSRTDLVRWTALRSGSVLQQFSGANNDAPLPPLAPPESELGLRYDRVAAVTPVAPPTPSFCPFRAAARQFDFMLGTWDVRHAKVRAVHGRATFSKSEADCLVEEIFTGPLGYEGFSFNTFDVFTQLWTRTYVDNLGQRLFLTGRLDGTRMVLRGTKRLLFSETHMRVTWDPTDPSTVVQRWEYSKDGTNWERGSEIVYTKR